MSQNENYVSEITRSILKSESSEASMDNSSERMTDALDITSNEGSSANSGDSIPNASCFCMTIENNTNHSPKEIDPRKQISQSEVDLYEHQQPEETFNLPPMPGNSTDIIVDSSISSNEVSKDVSKSNSSFFESTSSEVSTSDILEEMHGISMDFADINFDEKWGLHSTDNLSQFPFWHMLELLESDKSSGISENQSRRHLRKEASESMNVDYEDEQQKKSLNSDLAKNLPSVSNLDDFIPYKVKVTSQLGNDAPKDEEHEKLFDFDLTIQLIPVSDLDDSSITCKETSQSRNDDYKNEQQEKSLNSDITKYLMPVSDLDDLILNLSSLFRKSAYISCHEVKLRRNGPYNLMLEFETVQEKYLENVLRLRRDMYEVLYQIQKSRLDAGIAITVKAIAVRLVHSLCASTNVSEFQEFSEIFAGDGYYIVALADLIKSYEGFISIFSTFVDIVIDFYNRF